LTNSNLVEILKEFLLQESLCSWNKKKIKYW
jgi:hypothetical protein